MGMSEFPLSPLFIILYTFISTREAWIIFKVDKNHDEYFDVDNLL